MSAHSSLGAISNNVFLVDTINQQPCAYGLCILRESPAELPPKHLALDSHENRSLESLELWVIDVC